MAFLKLVEGNKKMCECANYYCSPVQYYYLIFEVKGLLKSSTLFFLDIEVHEFALKGFQYLEVYHANREHASVHMVSAETFSLIYKNFTRLFFIAPHYFGLCLSRLVFTVTSIIWANRI